MYIILSLSTLPTENVKCVPFILISVIIFKLVYRLCENRNDLCFRSVCECCDHNLPKILTALNGYSNSPLEAQRAAVTSFNGEVGIERTGNCLLSWEFSGEH